MFGLSLSIRDAHQQQMLNSSNPELKGTHKDHLSPTPGPAQDPNNHTLCLRALSKLFLNSVRLVAVTTSLGKLQCLTSVKTLFLKSNLIQMILLKIEA